MKEKIFAALAVDWDKETYEIYLVNPTGVHYGKVSAYTGAFFSDDDGVVQTSRAAKNMGELRPYSWVRLEDSTTDGLDLAIWYWIDLECANGKRPAEKLMFTVPKYGYAACYEERCGYLPVIEKICPRLDVETRPGDLSIDDQMDIDRQDKGIPGVIDKR